MQFNITKLQLLEAGKLKVRREYERREGTTEVKKKVELSKRLNESRLKVLQAQNDAMQAIQGDAQAGLGALAHDTTTYAGLLQGLLVEALYKLGESKAKVQCRKEDVALLQGLIPQAAVAYSHQFDRAAPEIEIDGQHSLPPASELGSRGEGFDTLFLFGFM